LVSEQDFFRTGEIHERLGYAYHQRAMQVESAGEFRATCSRAVENYEKAKEFYGRLNVLKRVSRMHYCDAMIAYVSYWLASEVAEKKRLIDECWRLTKKTLEAFEEAGETRDYGNAYNQLSISVALGIPLEWDFRTREKTWREVVEHGKQAIKFLLPFGDSYELAVVYAKTATILGWSNFFIDIDERERYNEEALGYWQEANKHEEAAQIELLPVGRMYGSQTWGAPGSDEALMNLEKALGYGKKTENRLVIGCGLDWLAFHTMWKATATEDPDERNANFKTALQYALDAKHQYAPIAFISPRDDFFWIESKTEYDLNVAMHETDLGKRRDLLEIAVESAPDGLRRAEDSGYPDIIGLAHHAFSKALASLALMEASPEEKKRLLEKALEHRNEAVTKLEQLEPFGYWNRGVMRNYLADIKSRLADLTENLGTRESMLQEATLEKENALKLIIKEAVYWESRIPGKILPFFVLGDFQYEYGSLLNRLYKLGQNREHLQGSAKAFKDSAESYQKVNLTSRVAESHWKAAQAYDDLGEHSKAAENFDLSSDSYKRAAEKIPQLKDFYQNQAIYMQAWSEIEKARHDHGRQQFDSAREHFKSAANAHQSLKKWSYLAPNYLAWAEVERAEDLSRKDQSEEAIRAFEQAVTLFDETKKSIQAQIHAIENVDEKHMSTNLGEATELRRQYCIGRIALEEARTLDKKGDHSSSSEKYGSAAEIFEKMTRALKTEQDRKEIGLLTILSRAWQKMTRAEAEEAPELYIEASQLFEEAKGVSPDEKSRMLALGHSHFCRALEAGTRFADTRDAALHAKAMQHLESAANYYVKADLQNASEYAKATELLFDAYVYIDNAKKETDPEKKTKLYSLAEKILQTSAGAFMKAGYPSKREQVLRLLERVKEERELALSLSEMLHAPAIVSTTSVFATLASTQENAVGSEGFEHANIQANVLLRRKELRIGENLDLELELVNAGKGPALLTKISEVIPQGFELVEKPENYRVEEGSLNMKGKRLDPLKTEDILLVLKPKIQGTFQLKPKILYLDESGKYRTHEPEPTTITVKELGIKGWLKGER
jgi:hypothetical protein